MKTLICVITICLVFFVVGASSVQSQTQVFQGYTFVRGGTGTNICLGTWVPSRDISLPGVCEGQMVDVDQLAAISTKQSADRLEQMLFALSSIDQKLSFNNDQIQKLIEVTVDTKTSIDQQVSQVSELLSEAIIERFDVLPEEILSNDKFKKEIVKLKEDILKEVEKHYLKRPSPQRETTPKN
ncbi:MAG: hypothetical protein A2Y97_05880 [Nitrospirae bacterium RBG_13_39_12]|nr:MAG: hypothetical protein A2Y97_05880 [Nitrospirae bacterium RBG_13_39_12]